MWVAVTVFALAAATATPTVGVGSTLRLTAPSAVDVPGVFLRGGVAGAALIVGLTEWASGDRPDGGPPD